MAAGCVPDAVVLPVALHLFRLRGVVLPFHPEPHDDAPVPHVGPRPLPEVDVDAPLLVPVFRSRGAVLPNVPELLAPDAHEGKGGVEGTAVDTE